MRRLRPRSPTDTLTTADPKAPASVAPWVGPAVVLGALILRVAAGLHGSFFLDDFHSLHHARVQGLGGFLVELTRDNHPPLSFLLLRAVRACFGEGEFALRLLNITLGTWAVAIAWRLGRRLPGRASRVVGVSFFALSSLHLDLSTNLRMYALLALAVLGILDAALDLLEPLSWEEEHPWAGLRLALWTAAALLAQYHALHALGILVLTLAFLHRIGGIEPGRLRAVLGALAVGALIALPWYAWGFPRQLANELAPGGSRISAAILAESLVHLILLRIDLLGPLRPIGLVAGIASVGLAGAGAFLLVLRARAHRSGLVLAWTLPAFGFALPLWAAAVAAVLPRAGFEWRYLAASIAPLALLAGASLAPGPWLGARRCVAGICLAAALGLDVATIADPGREDYRGASAYVAEHLSPGDGVLAMEWQPPFFPHGGGWAYYAALLGGTPDYRALEHTGDFALVEPEALRDIPRVFCILRSIPNGVPALRTLRARYPVEEKLRFGEGLWVLVFSGT